LKDKFPEYKDNELYITGESYAGIYVPQLVKRIDNYITEQKKTPGAWYPNLKGFAVGNGVTNWKFDCTPAFFHMAYYHGLIDDELFDAVNAKCDLSYYNAPDGSPLKPVLSDECNNLMSRFE